MENINTLENIKALLTDAPESVLKDIIKFSTNLLLSKDKSSPPVPSEEELDKLFTYVPNALNRFSLEVSTSLPSVPDILVTNNDVADSPVPIGPTNSEYAIEENDFFNEVRKEVLSLGLHKRSAKQKPATQWVLVKPHKHRHLRNAMKLDKFKYLSRLHDITNGHEECKGTMKGAIINVFSKESSRTRPHSDDEPYINQESSICTWTIGDEREFRIYPKKHSGDNHNDNDYIRSFTPQHGSLMIMQPGSQACTKHKVMPGKKDLCTSVDVDDDLSGLRISISWRDIIYDTYESETSTSGTNNVSQEKVGNNNTKLKDTSVIFGTSISKYLEERKLQGRYNIGVVNCSQSGARIADVSSQMDAFFTSEKIENEGLKIKNVFISVGTNDVAILQHKSPNHLYLPLLNLLKKAKMLFCGANIYFQSLLPMTVTSRFTVNNVLSFNKLLLKVCASEKCFYLDVFKNFLDSYGYNNIQLFRWNRRTNLIDVHLNSRGLGVLARSYIDHIRGRFNPIKY